MWLLLCSLLSPLRVPLLLSVVQVRIIQFHCLVRSWGLSEGHSAFAQPVCTVYQTVVWLCVFILVICPVVMQLVCITHFFVCQTLSLSLRLPCPPGCSRDVPFTGVDFTGILHICMFTILYAVVMCSCWHPPGWPYSLLLLQSDCH